MIYERMFQPMIRTDHPRFDNGKNEMIAMAVEIIGYLAFDEYKTEPGEILRVTLDAELRPCEDDDGSYEIHYLQLHASQREVIRCEVWWKTFIRKIFNLW